MFNARQKDMMVKGYSAPDSPGGRPAAAWFSGAKQFYRRVRVRKVGRGCSKDVAPYRVCRDSKPLDRCDGRGYTMTTHRRDVRKSWLVLSEVRRALLLLLTYRPRPPPSCRLCASNAFLESLLVPLSQLGCHSHFVVRLCKARSAAAGSEAVSATTGRRLLLGSRGCRTIDGGPVTVRL